MYLYVRNYYETEENGDPESQTLSAFPLIFAVFNVTIRIFIISVRAGTEPYKKFRKKSLELYKMCDLDSILLMKAWIA